MAEKYTVEEMDRMFSHIIDEMSDNGRSVRAILREDDNMPAMSTFFKWLSEDSSRAEQYARAMEIRAEGIFDEMFEIADKRNEDHTPFTGINVIQRDKLMIDTRKWALSRMNPKKYSDKLDVTSGGEKVNTSIPLVLEDGRTYEDLKNELRPEEEE